jgi:hypothetical protein
VRSEGMLTDPPLGDPDDIAEPLLITRRPSGGYRSPPHGPAHCFSLPASLCMLDSLLWSGWTLRGRHLKGGRMSSRSKGSQHEQDAGDVEQPTLAAWLVDKVATQALERILEENRRAHDFEDRIERLERSVALDGDGRHTGVFVKASLIRSGYAFP